MTFTELLALDQRSSTAKTLPSAKPDPMTSRHHAITPSRQSESTKPAKGDAATRRRHDAASSRPKPTMTPSAPAALIAQLRAAVKPLGKEVSTHRFTAAEKERLTELVYRYERRGYRTSENEMVRVAVNWLLEDHAARDKRGILHRVLRALHE